MLNKTFLTAMLISSFLNSQSLSAQNKTADYKNRISQIKTNINNYFFDSAANNYKEFTKRDANDVNSYCYLWPLCALIQAANEVEATGIQSNYMKPILKTIYNYADNTPPAPGYASYLNIKKADRYYDDNQWIGIACLDDFERTHNASYLFEGKKIYNFMMTGFDTLSGGGLYWKEGDGTSKNTCSNGPGIIVALQLYKATKKQSYLDTALLLNEWVNKNLESDNHVYFDNLKIPSLKIEKATFTYNTGTMLQSNVLLYEITKQDKYLIHAKQIAEAAYNHFYKNGRWPNGVWFNAVLLRGYIALYRYDKNIKYINAFITDSDSIWLTEKDANNLIGKKEKKELIDQAAMLEIYCRLLKFVK